MLLHVATTTEPFGFERLVVITMMAVQPIMLAAASHLTARAALCGLDHAAICDGTIEIYTRETALIRIGQRTRTSRESRFRFVAHRGDLRPTAIWSHHWTVFARCLKHIPRYALSSQILTPLASVQTITRVRECNHSLIRYVRRLRVCLRSR